MIICSFLFFAKEFTMTQQQNHKPTTSNVQIQSHQGDYTIGQSPQFVVTPASGPLRNHIHLIEANPLFQQEMLREVKSVANQRDPVLGDHANRCPNGLQVRGSLRIDRVFSHQGAK